MKHMENLLAHEIKKEVRFEYGKYLAYIDHEFKINGFTFSLEGKIYSEYMNDEITSVEITSAVMFTDNYDREFTTDEILKLEHELRTI